MRAGLETRKQLLDHLHKWLVFHVADSHDHHAIRRVVGIDVLAQVVLLNCLDVLYWSEDGKTQRIFAKHGEMKPLILFEIARWCVWHGA